MSELTKLEFNGADGSTTITDSGTNPKGITVGGNAQLDTAEKVTGTASLKLDGNGDYIWMGDSDDWDVSTDDFEIKGWIKTNAIGAEQTVFQMKENSSNNFIQLTILSTGILRLAAEVAGAGWGTPYPIDSLAALEAGVWYYFKIKKSGNTLSLMLSRDRVTLVNQGTMATSGAGPTGVFKFALGVHIQSGTGVITPGISDFNGWMDDIIFYRPGTTADTVPDIPDSGFFNIM